MRGTFLLTITSVLSSLAVVVSADTQPGANIEYLARYEVLLRSVPALELPARAAAYVSTAARSDKEGVGLAIVDVVARINPSALPTVVGAISRVAPTLSARLANEASTLQPRLAPAIKSATIVTSQGSNNRSAPSPVSDPQPSTSNNNGNGDNGYSNGNGNQNANGNGADNSNGNGKKKGHYKDN